MSNCVLGIDPGYGRMGYGVVETKNGIAHCLTYGCIETPATMVLPDRLYAIHRAVVELVREYTPRLVGVETILFQKNVKTAIAVAEARGVVLSAVAAAGVAVVEVTPTEVKQALTGYGKAEKQQVQYMVKQLFRFTKVPKPDDAADALAVAIATEGQGRF
ncbi:crossover junction endodeoxyribonuclease RuvC [Candidatus Uhrbacteria bacterium CG10_big_fil_rev_8_21_14_0_10_48_11]|uniref:Crossover junction endodeoxyribonuclease RuvC n=1 Tax=Candidatus Uhrbacteria bacterium CG10_big_fil_rev_8_21_14_0_10_48_11 TaxID=1975037 RepID=A0A2M8LEU8_9BACT|nr:MAG: crossover junction endodeoxyribonuclease RuvC [Candidatus Uhrbacteria bacterium CG10_big_fil_rev_8_21_14_0_10_48_11]